MEKLVAAISLLIMCTTVTSANPMWKQPAQVNDFFFLESWQHFEPSREPSAQPGDDPDMPEDSQEDHAQTPEDSQEDHAQTPEDSQEDDMPEIATLDVPEILQNPELPTGCESVALTIALSYKGYELEKTTIADEYLVYSDSENFAEGYVGNPRSDAGTGVFPPGLAASADAYLKTQNSQERARDISGSDFTDLLAYVAKGEPVVVWTTMYMMEPEFTEFTAVSKDRTYTWYLQEHCVVLSGYNLVENTVTVSDPLEGVLNRNLDEFSRIYEATGKNALIIH